MARPKLIRAGMIEANRRVRLTIPPEQYIWEAVWWRLHSKESANPKEPLGYARSLVRLAKDMGARPDHYSEKPNNLTDWQWSGIGSVNGGYIHQNGVETWPATS